MTDAPLRSRNWFAPKTLDGFMHRSYLKAEGFSDAVFDGRPRDRHRQLLVGADQPQRAPPAGGRGKPAPGMGRPRPVCFDPSPASAPGRPTWHKVDPRLCLEEVGDLLGGPDGGRRVPGDRPLVAGGGLRANVWVSGNDRAGVERLCRYILRPPFAQERLRLRSDGRVALELKQAWHKVELFRSGGSAVVRRFFQEVDARRVVADVLTVSDPTAVSALINARGL